MSFPCLLKNDLTVSLLRMIFMVDFVCLFGKHTLLGQEIYLFSILYLMIKVFGLILHHFSLWLSLREAYVFMCCEAIFLRTSAVDVF